MELMLNSPASAPPVMEYESKGDTSGSVAATVVTAVEFSATVTVALTPPPLEVITGGSSTSVTVTAIAWLSVLVPSETWTVTS